MKKSITITLGLVAVLLSQAASADNRHNRGYGRHYNSGYFGSGYSFNYGARDTTYYSYNRRPRGGYYGISIGGGHYRHDSFSAGSFVGGLLLGSILTYPRSSARYYNDTYYQRAPIRNSNQVTIIKRSHQRSNAFTSGRRLLRDLQGRCFEIIRDVNGDELRTELEPEACNF